MMKIIRRRRKRMVQKLLIAGAGAGVLVGAFVMYVFDPQRGRARRAKTRDQAFGLIRHGTKRVRRTSRKLRSDALGLTRRMVHRERFKVFDDTTLAQKVKTELFSHPEIPKGKISVNVDDKVAVLRGEVDSPEQINKIERIVEDIQGVAGVESFMHLKGTPAPNELEVAGRFDGSRR